MIIRRLSLHNFGIYAGDNTYTFTHQKPIELIGGMNGRGKTTFLNAVLIALYGQNSFSYKESSYNTYGQYLKAHVNTSDGTNRTFVEMEFVMDQEDDNVYVVRRSWNGNQTRVWEKLSVTKNGESDQFLTDNWDMYIESVIPSALSKFFFFDGEQIAEIVSRNDTKQIRGSIRALLGIDIIDTLQKDLRRVSNRVRKTTGIKLDTEKAETLRKERDEANEALDAQDQLIEKKNAELLQVNKDLEDANAAYKRIGGDSVEKRESNKQKRDELKTRINTEQEKLIAQCAGALPFGLVRDLIDDINKQVKLENNAKTNNVAVERIRELISEYSKENGNSQDLSSFLSFADNSVKESSVKMIYDLSSTASYQVRRLDDGLIENTIAETNNILKKRDKMQRKVEDLDNYLSLDIDEDAVRKQFVKIKKLETKQAGLEAEIKQLETERKTLHGNQMKKESAFNRFMTSQLNNLETSDDSDRILKYTHLMNEVFDKYKIRLQEEKLDLLGDTISDCYRKLRNKSNLIDHVKIDYQTLNFNYYNKNNVEIDSASLSAGEKQMVIVCVLWGLAICSKRNLPVIIDTPLGRMDSINRDVLVQKYFPEASDQVIILSTDTEIDRKYYKMMKPNISDEYLIVFDNENNCSHIEKGYFFGDAS